MRKPDALTNVLSQKLILDTVYRDVEARKRVYDRIDMHRAELKKLHGEQLKAIGRAVGAIRGAEKMVGSFDDALKPLKQRKEFLKESRLYTWGKRGPGNRNSFLAYMIDRGTEAVSALVKTGMGKTDAARAVAKRLQRSAPLATTRGFSYRSLMRKHPSTPHQR